MRLLSAAVSTSFLAFGCGGGTVVIDETTDAGSETPAQPDDGGVNDGSDAAPDATPGPVGDACATGGTCASGHCVDGVCCESACEGTCVACSNVATGQADGLCAPVVRGTDPANECAASAPESCGQAGVGCNGDASAPACLLYDETTQCGAALCTEGQATPAAFCSGTGTCQVAPASACAPYVCAQDACGSSCSQTSECAAGYYCADSACVPTLDPGSVCSGAEQCGSGFCADGVCCDSACDQGCAVCSAAAGASADGTCSPRARGSAGTCALPQMCNGAAQACIDACVDGQATPLQRQVDVLVMVDNSGSMTQEIVAIQRAINTHFANVLQDAGVDYRTVFLTRHGNAVAAQSMCITAPLSGLASCTPVPPQPVFNERFVQHSVEIGSTNAWSLFVHSFNAQDEFNLLPTGFKSFLRPNVFKDLIVVTDDNSSLSAANVEAQILALSDAHFGTAEALNFRVDAFVGISGEPLSAAEPVRTTKCTDAVNFGNVHQQLAIRMGGVRYSSCNTAAYPSYFADIAARLVVETRCKLDLPEAPAGSVEDLDTLRTKITFGGNTVVDIPAVANAAACAGDGYFVTGRTVQLCPTTCNAVANDRDARIQTIYLCE